MLCFVFQETFRLVYNFTTHACRVLEFAQASLQR